MTPVSDAGARWAALTQRTMAEVAACDPIYRPTTFWTSGVQTLADDLEQHGLPTFKSWPSASWWFYPRYGSGMSKQAFDAAQAEAQRMQPGLSTAWFRTALSGRHQARRDFDAARLSWDQSRWPFDLEGLGESLAGSPPEEIRFEKSSPVTLTRPYLNYLLMLAGLSRHVEAPPRRFLELGGGFGVLGEILLSRTADAVYVDLDIPPLLTVASYYLDTLFGDRVTTYDGVPPSGQLDLGGSACLPSWRIRDLTGPFDVFVNSFSFQEMEPDVLDRYVGDVAALEVEWIVSLNSRRGKQRKDAEHDVGVLEPVTSRDIVRSFESRGYELIATYGEPMLDSRGELAILRRNDGTRSALGRNTNLRTNLLPPAGDGSPIDLRRPFSPQPRGAITLKRPAAKAVSERLARAGMPKNPKATEDPTARPNGPRGGPGLRRLVRRLVPRSLRTGLRALTRRRPRDADSREKG